MRCVLMMEKVSTSETPVSFYQSTLRNISEAGLDRGVGRLIILCPFKLIFFKNVFNIYLVGMGRK
jgi:hypothetical protein